jgi:hypothetical protein
LAPPGCGARPETRLAGTGVRIARPHIQDSLRNERNLLMKNFLLQNFGASGIVGFPTKLGSSDASVPPNGTKIADFFVSADQASFDAFTNWRNSILMSERLRQLSLGWGVLFRHFFLFSKPQLS